MTAISFNGRHFQRDMILQSVRWYLAYALSYRDIEEIMQERGFDVDHSTIHRWVILYSPQLVQNFCSKKRKPTGRWRLDETYVKVKGKWKYYYRAVDKYGETIDFLLTAKRDTKAVLRYLRKAIGSQWKTQPDQHRSEWCEQCCHQAIQRRGVNSDKNPAVQVFEQHR